MNHNYYKQLRFNESGLGCFLTLILVAILLSSVGLGWIWHSALILVLFLTITPVIAWFAFRWWLQKNLVQGECPVCSYGLTGLNENELQCPNCGETLKVEAGTFQRLTPPGTIEVEAVEINSDQ
jgi:energy-coupling factor transporter transmembrane protein EcfT